MNWKGFLKSSVPFVAGLLIGSSLTRNKMVFFILIFYVVAVFAINLFAKKAGEIKSSTDKKLALRNAGMEAVNNAAGYIGEGNSTGGRLFDKWFPKLSIFLGIGMIVWVGYMLCFRRWLDSLIAVFALFVYVVLINIWRKVKFLGVDKDD